MSFFPVFTKTRLAPTPSGFLHAGNALNFLLTVAVAHRCGARLLLRVDDLDQPRRRPAYVNDIFETLWFLGVKWHEGPNDATDLDHHWSQQHRMPMYLDALQMLREKNRVFACTCSRTGQADCHCLEKVLPLDGPHTSWRLLTGEEPIRVKNPDGSFTTAALPKEMKNFIVRRKDGLPAYQLASVVDDLYFNIDFIVRGQDLWPSTLAQLQLAAMLEKPAFASIAFYHHPLLKNSDGEKLSKSAGAMSVKHWREEGKSKEELLAHLREWLLVSGPSNHSHWMLELLNVV
jgi:glutamyl-tRNA synthetase